MKSRRMLLFVVSFFFFIAVFTSLPGVRTAYAGAGSFTKFEVNTGGGVITVDLVVTCPGDVGFSWRVGLDGFDKIVGADSTKVGHFTIPGSIVPNGHHNLPGAVRCNGEPNDWTGATVSTKDFDWYGGNPTPPPPPPPQPGTCSITLAPQNSNVTPNTQVGFTASAKCSNGVRTIQFFVDGNYAYELTTEVVTFTWQGAPDGQHSICAKVFAQGDDTGANAKQACSTMTVTTQPVGGPTDVNPPPPVTAANCHIDRFDTDPGASSFSKGTQVRLTGSGSCDDGIPRAAKFTLDGASYAETMGGSDSYTVDTNQISGGNHTWCFMVASNGDTDWSHRGEQCRTYTIGDGGGNPPPQQGYVCDGALSQRLSVGKNAKVINGSIRLRPAAMSGDTTTTLAEGTIVSVIGGPVCGDFKIYWWQVNASGTTGWVPEGRPDAGYWMEPTSDGPVVSPPVVLGNTCTQGVPPPTRMSVGMKIQRAQVTRYGNGRIRSGAGTNYPVIRNAAYGEQITITGGPTRLPASLWWNVKFDDGFEGFAMEGYCESDGTVDYYFEPAQTTVTITPTATATPQAQTDQGVTDSPCSIAVDDSSIIPKAYADDNKPAGFPGGQCVQYVRWFFPKLLKDDGKKCTTGPNFLAKEWADAARSCSWSVDGNPRELDVAVWGGKCDIANTDAGHVAVVVAVGGDKIEVFDANHNGDQKDHVATYKWRGIGCLQFIHLPDGIRNDHMPFTGNQSSGPTDQQSADTRAFCAKSGLVCDVRAFTVRQSGQEWCGLFVFPSTWMANGPKFLSWYSATNGDTVPAVIKQTGPSVEGNFGVKSPKPDGILYATCINAGDSVKYDLGSSDPVDWHLMLTYQSSSK